MASVYLNPPPQRDHSHHRHPFQLDHHDHISHLQQLLPYSSSSSSSSHDQVREATAAIYLNLTADQRMMELEESQRDHLQKVDQCSADGRSSNVESPPIQASKMITMNNNISNSNLPLRKREIAEIRSASIDISSSSSSTSAKWTASKMRLMQKMISKNNTTESADDDQDQHKQQQLHENGSNNNTSNSNAIRVCSDCNTTTTPLWRSGPRGPKSLCNACGIRKRKARRALEAAAAGGGGNGSTATATTTTTTTSTTDQSSFTKIKLQIKKPRTSHVMSTHHHHHHQQQQQQQQLNKQQSESDLENQQQQQQQRYDDDDDENQSQGKLFFQGFGVGNDSALKHACTQDVAEAAHLLMELSSGASIHTY